MTHLPKKQAPSLVAIDEGATEPLTPEDALQFAEAEREFERSSLAYILAGSALRTIRDSRLYRATFSNFDAYMRVRWGLSRTHADRLIAAARLAEKLTPFGAKKPATESAARELLALEARPDVAVATYAAVTKERSNATAADVKIAVRAVVAADVSTPAQVAATVRESLRPHINVTPPKSDVDADRRDVERLGDALRILAANATWASQVRAKMTVTEQCEVEQFIDRVRDHFDRWIAESPPLVEDPVEGSVLL